MCLKHLPRREEAATNRNSDHDARSVLLLA